MENAICLEQYRLIAIEGNEAEKYLQGQLTSDVTKLTVGQSTLTAHCDPKGKMSAVFRLFRLAPQQFYALIRAELLPSALDQLKKYAVFSQVSFTLLDAKLIGFNGSLPNIPAQHCLSFNERHILINPEIQDTFLPSSYWDRLDIQQGYPILMEKTQFEFLPQALNLQAIEQAISFQKGCYIGQEMVARAKYRGANKRAMFTLKTREKTTALAQIGGEIEIQLETGWRKTGTIISALNMEDILWLQVVMNQDLTHTSFRLESGEILDIYPLPYTLVTE